MAATLILAGHKTSNPVLPWQVEYTARRAYGRKCLGAGKDMLGDGTLSVLGPGFWECVARNTQEDQLVFQRYLQFNTVSYPVPGEAESVRRTHVCALNTVLKRDVEQCLNAPVE